LRRAVNTDRFADPASFSDDRPARGGARLNQCYMAAAEDIFVHREIGSGG
jgi:hypothetical protein